MTSIFSHKVLLMDFFFACMLKKLVSGFAKKYSYVFLATCLFSNLIYVFSLDTCHLFSFYVKKGKFPYTMGAKSMLNRVTFLFLFTCVFTRFFLTTNCAIVRFKMMIKNAAKNIFIFDHGLRFKLSLCYILMKTFLNYDSKVE